MINKLNNDDDDDGEEEEFEGVLESVHQTTKLYPFQSSEPDFKNQKSLLKNSKKALGLFTLKLFFILMEEHKQHYNSEIRQRRHPTGKPSSNQSFACFP